jgi:hypothetical protein
MKTVLFSAALALGGGLLASADEIILTNGHRIVGIHHRDARDPNRVIVEVGTGTIVLDAKEVSSVNPGRTLLHDYEDRYNALKGSTSVNDYYALALWAKDNRLTRYLTPLAEQMLKLDPQHEGAHRLLGQELVGHEWLPYEEAQAKRGLRLVNDRWMSKADIDLMEKNRLEAKIREDAQKVERERKKAEERERRRKEAEAYQAWYQAQTQDLDGYFYRPDWCWPYYFRPYPWASYVRSRRNYQWGNFYGSGAVPVFGLGPFLNRPMVTPHFR